MSKDFLRALSGVVTDPSRTPLIPVLLPALERHGRVCRSEAARARLLAVSAATMDRLLSEVLVVARGGQRRRSGFSSAVRRAVPVRTFGDWNDPLPSYVEVDLVAHAGTSAAGAAGSFVQTVVLTDVATGWTESLEMNWLADRCERSGCGAGGALAAAMGDERWPAARLAVAGRWHCSPPRAASGRRGGGGATSTFNRRTAKSISHRFARGRACGANPAHHLPRSRHASLTVLDSQYSEKARAGHGRRQSEPYRHQQQRPQQDRGRDAASAR